MHRETDKKRLFALILSVALLSLLFFNCEGVLTTPIKKILDNPREFDGKTVTISGEVTEVYSLLLIKYFVVRDKTGEIMVVTDRPLPKKGTQIRVKGTAKEAFSLGNQQVIVILEYRDTGPQKQ